MDSDRFVRMVRDYGLTATRRGALTFLSALGLQSLLVAEAAAKKKHKNKNKKKQTCQGAKKVCFGQVVDVSTNAQHCGYCGHVCELGSCTNGACTCPDSGEEDPCPAGCDGCASSIEGGNYCYSNPWFASCNENADCPLGTVCGFTGECMGACFL